jgi:hypothetical protein
MRCGFDRLTAVAASHSKAREESDGRSSAVARKLAVLLHHLWISCEEYEPLHNTRKGRPVAA